MKKKYTPKLLIKYLLKQFSYSLLIFFSIFLSLIILSNYIEEIIFFRDKITTQDIFFETFVLALAKTPTNLLTMSPFIFLFASTFYFVKLIKSNEIIPVKLGGLSNNFLILTPAFFSVLIGIFLITFLTPISAELSKHYEINKRKYAANENLIIMSKNGLWVKEKMANKTIIIRADIIKSQNFKNLNNLTIYEIDNNYKLIERIDAKNSIIKNKNWELNQPEKLIKKTDIENNKIIYKTNINLEKLKNYFANANIYSIWNITKELKELKDRGYVEQDLIVNFNKYLSLPLMLFSMVIISTFFTIRIDFKFNNFLYIFFSILVGIIIYFLSDLSIAIGKSGKIPLILSIWIPVIIIMTLSIYSLLRSDD